MLFFSRYTVTTHRLSPSELFRLVSFSGHTAFKKTESWTLIQYVNSLYPLNECLFSRPVCSRGCWTDTVCSSYASLAMHNNIIGEL